MTRFIYFITALLIAAISVNAQDSPDFVPVNWDEIQYVATNRPDSIRELARRLTSRPVDITLPSAQLRLAYFGMSHLSQGADWVQVMEAQKAFTENDSQALISHVNQALAINPLSLPAMYLKFGYIISELNDNPNTNFTEDDKEYCIMVLQQELKAIAATGNGTRDFPFFVATIDDEYHFMDIYLEITRDRIKSQSLTRGDHYIYDKFDLKQSSQYYQRPDIYFEVSHVLRLEENMFGPAE